MMRRLGLIAILTFIPGGSAFAQSDRSDGYDLTRLGLYTGSGEAISCSTTASSTKVSCPGGVGDFAIGQGVEIPLAGVAVTFNAWGVTTITSYARTSNVATYSYTGPVPGAGQTVKIAGLADDTFNGPFKVIANNGDFGTFTVANAGSNLAKRAGSGTATITSAQVVVTPAGILNGNTSYHYKIVLRGYHGELSVASPAGETTTGAATLGVNSVAVTSCSRTSGVATCITSAAHHFQSGVQIDLEGTTSIAYNGAHQISSTPGGTTFTFLQASASDDSSTSTGGTAKVVAKNVVQWNMQQYTVLQSIVYRSKNGGAYSIVGVVEGMDGAFVDWGLGAPTVPAYIPVAPPARATNGILSARITSVVGTTLTLDTAATATTSSQTAKHDNTPVVLAGCAAIGTASNSGGTLYFPSHNPTAIPVFNSPLDLYHSCNVNQLVLALASSIQLNEPLIEQRAGITIKGISPTGTGPRDAQKATTSIIGDAYPMIYFVPGSFGPKSIENIHFQPTRPYQSAFVEDSDAGGGNVVNANYSNTFFTGSSGTMPGIIRGGFNNFFLNGGAFTVTGTWGVPEALQMTIQNSLGLNPLYNSLPYISKFEGIAFRQHGMEWNDWGHAGPGVGGYMTITDSLMEDGYMPMLTFNVASTVTRIEIDNPVYADFLAGASTPFIQTGTSRVYATTVKFPYCANGNQPLFEGTIGGVEVEGGFAAGCTLSGTSSSVSTTLNGRVSQRAYANISVQASGTGQFYYAMDLPAAPASVVVSAGGSVPIGTHCFGITANDPNGGETLVGPTTCAKTTGGNQTLTITRPTLPTNAVAWNPYWIVGGRGKLACYSIPIGTVSYVHSVGFACTNTVPALNTAGRAALGSNGLSANQYTGNKIDLIGGVAPSVPAPALGRLFFNSSTKALGCLNSDGSSCLPVGNFLVHRELIAAAGFNNGVCSARYNTAISPTERAGANVRECQIPMADGDAVEPPPILLPLDWTGAVDVGILFSDASTSGTVIFNVATACSPVNGTATDDTVFNTAQALDTITLKRPANGQWLTMINGINTTGCTAGQPLQLRITRAKDSAAGAANVRAYSLTYRTTNAR